MSRHHRKNHSVLAGETPSLSKRIHATQSINTVNTVSAEILERPGRAMGRIRLVRTADPTQLSTGAVMLWQIKGADSKTGQGITIQLKATSELEAKDKAQQLNIFVESIGQRVSFLSKNKKILAIATTLLIFLVSAITLAHFLKREPDKSLIASSFDSFSRQYYMKLEHS